MDKKRSVSAVGAVVRKDDNQLEKNRSTYLIKVINKLGDRRTPNFLRVVFDSREFKSGALVSLNCSSGAEGDKDSYVGQYLLPAGFRTLESSKDYISGGFFQYLKDYEIDQIIKSDEKVKVFEAIDFDNASKVLSQLGIKSSQAKMIAYEWGVLSSARQDWTMLNSLNAGKKQARNIVQFFGNHSAQGVSASPYQLTKIRDVGFRTADRLAQSIGVGESSEFRENAIISFSFSGFLESGDTLTENGLLIKKAMSVTNLREGRLQSILDRMTSEGLVQRFEKDGVTYCAPDTAVTKEQVTLQMIEKLKSESAEREVDFNPENPDFPFSVDQKSAIDGALKNMVSIVVGGPGTGKTAVVAKSIIESLEAAGETVAIATPTGKASRRIEQEVGRQAGTLNSLFFSVEGREYSTLIVDESSMIDASNAAKLMAEVTAQNARLILIGDPDQLPPVNYGNFLKDMLDTGAAPSFRLTTVFRQVDLNGKENEIKLNARRINNGEMPELERNLEGDFHWIDAKNDKEIAEKISGIVGYIPDHYDIPLDDIQVLSPQKSTPAGVNALNKSLANIMNPGRENKSSIQLFGESYHEGDYVMQTKNDKKSGVNNGDTGKITNINLRTQLATVRFDHKEVSLSFPQFNFLQLANAITIHKSQGSEYGAVIIPVSMSHKRMLAIDLLMTAVTRGKKQVFMVGSRQAMELALKTKNKRRRATWMAHKNNLMEPAKKCEDTREIDYQSAPF